MKIINQNNFWSGMVNDPRSTLPGGFWYSENFDVGRKKSLKQVVNNTVENSCSYSVDNYITKLIQVGTDIYGLGQDNNTNHDTTIWKKTNALDGAWGIPTNGTIASTTFNAGDALFISNMQGTYQVIYLDGGNSKVAKYTIATDTMSSTAINLANAKGGVVWQGDVYCWSGQDIYKINATTDALTSMKSVSSEQTIVDLVPYGNLMAVVCTSTTTKSKMYLWDGVSTTTWVEILEIGVGTVSGGALLEGMIVVAISTPNKRTLKLKGYNGGQFQNLFTYTARLNRAGTYNYILPASKLKTFTGYVYFLVTGTKPDGTYAGLYEYAIARYGREEPVNPMTFSIYKTIDFTSARGVDGQTANNDFTIIENIVGGSTTAERSVAALINSDTNKTTFFLSSSSTYSSQPGVLETVKFGWDDGSIDKQLKSVASYFTGMTGTGGVTMKYKKDEDLTWTTICTDTTSGNLTYMTNIVESTGANLPQFKEIQLRIECLDGIELTGYKLKYEELSQNF